MLIDGVYTMNDRWITDWEPSERFPVYTRANAGEILPDPVSPLGWDLIWEEGVSKGWADGAHRQGVFTPDESNPDQPDYIACFGGYLYLNCLLYTSPSPRDRQKSRMPSSA